LPHRHNDQSAPDYDGLWNYFNRVFFKFMEISLFCFALQMFWFVFWWKPNINFIIIYLLSKKSQAIWSFRSIFLKKFENISPKSASTFNQGKFKQILFNMLLFFCRAYNWYLTHKKLITCFFLFQSYADEGHDLSGVLEHTYKSMEDFMNDCLVLETDASLSTPKD
jgi:hypothetical protein